MTWFVQHYAKSPKPAHQQFIHFVTLKVERAELTGQRIAVIEPGEAMQAPPRSLMMPKAKVRPNHQQKRQEMPAPCPWEEEPEDASIFELILEGTMPPYQPPQAENPPNTALEMRVINMENALARVIEFLEQNHASQAAQAELN